MPKDIDTGELDTSSKLGIVLERIDALREDVGELNKRLSCLNDSYQSFQKAYVRESVKLDSIISSAHQRLDNHEARLGHIEKQFEELAPQIKLYMRIMAIVGGMFLASIMALLWEIYIHRATILFP